MPTKLTNNTINLKLACLSSSNDVLMFKLRSNKYGLASNSFGKLQNNLRLIDSTYDDCELGFDEFDLNSYLDERFKPLNSDLNKIIALLSNLHKIEDYILFGPFKCKVSRKLSFYIVNSCIVQESNVSNIVTIDRFGAILTALAYRTIVKQEWNWNEFKYDKIRTERQSLFLFGRVGIRNCINSAAEEEAKLNKSDKLYWLYGQYAHAVFVWFPVEVMAICAFRWLLRNEPAEIVESLVLGNETKESIIGNFSQTVKTQLIPRQAKDLSENYHYKYQCSQIFEKLLNNHKLSPQIYLDKLQLFIEMILTQN